MKRPGNRYQGRDVGATLVVARMAHRVRRQRGDHKGRPYIFHPSSDIR